MAHSPLPKEDRPRPVRRRPAPAGNRYFEHRTFTTRETAYCRTTRQALVRATADHLTPTGGAA
ncbi:hypothetical protein Misp04_41430 [Micromonospora sp. NBRC 101691]|nr:hypothetical protein Misp04_41430 [Micromonospora sp. NBRC 101691]